MKMIYTIKRILPLVLIVLMAILGSCKDDVFDPKIVERTYQNKFPVKDIDPLQNWKLTRSVSIDISVYEDYGVDYTVEIFDHNPYSTDTVPHLLGQGTANQGLPFRTTIDCPTALTTLYVTRVDPAGRRLMKPVYISDDRLTTSFGSKPTPDTRSLTRAASDGSEVPLQSMPRPYTDREIETLLSKAVEYKGQDMDANLNKQTIYKITGTYKGGINHGGSLTPEPQALQLIVAPGATWNISSNQVINQGLEIIVASKGKINLKSGSQWNPSLKFTNTASLVVLGSAYEEDEANKAGNTRGSISGNGWIEFSNGGTNYNAGDISIDGINNNGGTFFNYGEIDIKDLIGSSTGSLYVNHGSIMADKIGSDESIGPLIENSCKIYAHTHLASYGIKMGRGARIDCKHLYAYNYIDLSANSMIKVENNSKFFDCNITGPTAKGSQALLSLDRVSAATWKGTWEKECTQGYLINNIYCEYKENNSDWDFANGYLNGKAGGYGMKGNGNAVLCPPGNAPAYIPAGSCSGDGNTPDESGSDIPKDPITYTYAFEDNFPRVGDYDFNDIVLDVNIKYIRGLDNKITATHITATLVAAGASKPVGAGLRIVGDKAKAAVENVTYGGADKERFLASLSSGTSLFATGMESDMTIPLFGNEFEVLGVPKETLVNTGQAVAQPRTLEIIIEQKGSPQSEEPSITKDNLDFFIGYKYLSMPKRMEVHLYEFREYGATAAGNVQEVNLALAKNNTWAICVPNFRYPKERINICDEENINNCAYPKFLEWTRDRTKSIDWYNYPNETVVYR